MINIAFLLDISGSMSNQLSGVKQTIARLVQSVFEADAHGATTITVITFTEMGHACYVTKHSFEDGKEAVAFVSSIKLCAPPGRGVTNIYGGNDGAENQKAALAELLTLDNTVPTIAFHITDDGPHLVASARPVSEAAVEAEYLKTKHGMTDYDTFHVLARVQEHFGQNLILNVVKYVKTQSSYGDHRLYGAIAKQFGGVLITPRVNVAEQLAAGLMEIFTKLFESFTGTVSELEGESEAALEAFAFFNLDAIETLPTCEADVLQIATPVAGSTTEVLYQLIDRACVIVGKKFAKRAIKATGLQEQVELLLVAAKCLTKTMPLNAALDRATSLLEKIRELVPAENQGHIKIQASDLPLLLSPDAISETTSALEAAVSAITLMSTEETVKAALGEDAGDADDVEEKPVAEPAVLLQTAGSLFLGHLAVLQFPEKNGAVDFMDAWSAVVHKVSNDVMTAADFLTMIGSATSTGGLSIRSAEYNYAQMFADPSDSVGSALLRVASGTQVLDILTGLLAGAPPTKFAPNMFRGTIAACLKTLVAHHEPAPLTSYQWDIVRKLVHSIRLLMGPRSRTMRLEPESALAKLLFQLLRLETGDGAAASSSHSTSDPALRVAVRGFLEEVLAGLVQGMTKFRGTAYLALVEGMVAYTHAAEVEDVSEPHALDQDVWKFDADRATAFAAASELSQSFRVCAANVLEAVFGSEDKHRTASDGAAEATPSLEDVWPSWRADLPKCILLGKRTARYSSSTDSSAPSSSNNASGAPTATATTTEWTRNDKLSRSLDDELFQSLAMLLLRKKHDAFLRDLRARREDAAAELRWLRALKLMRLPFGEFVAALPTAVYSSGTREHKLLLKAFKYHGAELDLDDYEAKVQVVVTGRLVDATSDTIVFNRGNLHSCPDAFVPMSDAFQTRLRVLQQTRQWKLSHTYRPSNLKNHSGYSNKKPSSWARMRSLSTKTFWTR